MYSSIVLIFSLFSLSFILYFVLGKKPSMAMPVMVVLGDPDLSDEVKKNGEFSEDDLEIVDNLKETLDQLKEYEFTYVDEHTKLLEKLYKSPPEFVFNLCDEGYRNSPKMELHLPAYLELLGIPYTGSGPACLAICFNKALVTNYAKSINIPVPKEILVESDVPPVPDFFPAFVKPALGDGSIGISEHSVVSNEDELMRTFKNLKKLFPHTPIVIQEFLPGREFSVGVIGNEPHFTALPILEIDYSGLAQNLPKILSYDSKWDYGDSPYWNDIEYVEAELSPNKERELIDYSLKIFKLLGCRDYAVFDFREDREGRIKFLEVNPNPGWCEECTLDTMAKFKGWNYKTLLKRILKAAEGRWKNG